MYQFLNNIYFLQNMKGKFELKLEAESDPSSPCFQEYSTHVKSQSNPLKSQSNSLKKSSGSKRQRRTLIKKIQEHAQNKHEEQKDGFRIQSIFTKIRSDRIVKEFIKKLKYNIKEKSFEKTQSMKEISQDDDFFNLGKRKLAEEQFESELINQNKINTNGLRFSFETSKLILRFTVTLVLSFIISLQISFEDVSPLDEILNWVSLLSFFQFFLDFASIFFFTKVANLSKIRMIYLWVRFQNKYWDIIGNFGLIFHLFNLKGVNQIINIILILLLIKKLLVQINRIKKLQKYFIVNSKIERYFDLIKILMINYAIGHILSIILNLVALTEKNSSNSWYSCKNLDFNVIWYERYIWGYYWATNIMLTVGFGDIYANNFKEAGLLILIQTFACIILAFNISEVSKILGIMGEMDQQKNRKLKVISQLGEKNGLDKQFLDNLQGQVEKSIEEKYQLNIQEEKEVISQMSQKMQSEIKRQVNKPIFKHVSFFINLTKRTQLSLAQKFQKLVTHPDEILLKNQQNWKIFILRSGTAALTYKKGASKNNGVVIEEFHLNQNNPVLLSLKFIKKERINGDLRSLDISTFSILTNEQLQGCLKDNDHSMFEYYCMLKDRTQTHLFENQITECKICHDKHGKVECPKMHYSPFKFKVIQKKKINSIYGNKKQNRDQCFNRKKKSSQLSQIFIMYKQKKQIESAKCLSQNGEWNATKFPSIHHFNNEYWQMIKKIDKCQVGIDETLKILKDDLTEDQLNVDKAHNYKKYFCHFNSELLQKISLTSTSPIDTDKMLNQKITDRKIHKTLF